MSVVILKRHDLVLLIPGLLIHTVEIYTFRVQMCTIEIIHLKNYLKYAPDGAIRDCVWLLGRVPFACQSLKNYMHIIYRMLLCFPLRVTACIFVLIDIIIHFHVCTHLQIFVHVSIIICLHVNKVSSCTHVPLFINHHLIVLGSKKVDEYFLV